MFDVEAAARQEEKLAAVSKSDLPEADTMHREGVLNCRPQATQHECGVWFPMNPMFLFLMVRVQSAAEFLLFGGNGGASVVTAFALGSAARAKPHALIH